MIPLECLSIHTEAPYFDMVLEGCPGPLELFIFLISTWHLWWEEDMLTFLFCMLFVIIIGIIILAIVHFNEQRKTRELLGGDDFEIGYSLKKKENVPEKHVIDQLLDMAQEHLDNVRDHHVFDDNLDQYMSPKKKDTESQIYETKDEGG